MRNQDLSGFLTSLFGEIDGYVYVPTKTIGGVFERNFFKWPEQRDIVEDFILKKQSSVNVFISPSLWKSVPNEKEKLKPEHWLGSQYLWTEFDGQIPKDLKDVPNPSIKVQSSGPENQHWYWRLSYLETNLENLETLNKKITYHLEGDLSAWDYIQVLRAPCTKNHKPNKGQTCKLIKNDPDSVTLDKIVELTSPPRSVFLDSDSFRTEDIPNPAFVLGNYKFGEETLKLITQSKLTPKDRSKALFAVACDMCKNKAKNIDILAILKWLDDRWGKFKNRDDQIKPLLGLIANARLSTKTSEEENEIADDEKIASWIFNAMTVRENIKPVDWIVKDVLTRSGITEIVADPGVGKTRLSMQLSMCLALGEDFLGFKIPNAKRVMFIHNELERDEHEEFHGPMMRRYDPDAYELLAANYFPVFVPDKLIIETEEDYKLFRKMIDMAEPDIIVMDTLSATAGNPSDWNKMTTFFQMMNQTRSETGSGLILPHHTRKDPNIMTKGSSSKIKSIDEVYGGRPVTQFANTILGMWTEHNIEKEQTEGPLPVELYCIKQRFRKKFMPVKLLNTDFSDFKRAPRTYDEHDIEHVVEKMNGDVPKQRRSKKPSERTRHVEPYPSEEYDTDNPLDF